MAERKKRKRNTAVATLHPIPNFLPGVDLQKDQHFQTLKSGMTDREVEFAKGMCVYSEFRAIVRAILPSLSLRSVDTTVSRLSHTDSVLALYIHLDKLSRRNHSDEPYTNDQSLKDMAAIIQMMVHNKDKFEMIIKYRRECGWFPPKKPRVFQSTTAEDRANEPQSDTLDPKFDFSDWDQQFREDTRTDKGPETGTGDEVREPDRDEPGHPQD